MAKMIFSLGFWMTIVLFIALGLRIRPRMGLRVPRFAELRLSTRLRSHHLTFQIDNPHFENDLGASDVARRRRCAANATSRSDYPDFQQMANLQAGDRPTYAPGILAHDNPSPSEVSLCPGPIEIPRH